MSNIALVHGIAQEQLSADRLESTGVTWTTISHAGGPGAEESEE